MKQGKPLTRTPFRRRQRDEGPTAAREVKPWAAALASATLRPARTGSYAGTTAAAQPKSEPYRDPVLLEMARGRPCLLMVPAVCNHRTDTTVAAHSNHQAHGKAMGRKADDCFVVEACSACHYWLDFGKASAAQKDRAFMDGHALQVLAWRIRATDPTEPERFRRAARRAVDSINSHGAGQ